MFLLLCCIARVLHKCAVLSKVSVIATTSLTVTHLVKLLQVYLPHTSAVRLESLSKTEKDYSGLLGLYWLNLDIVSHKKPLLCTIIPTISDERWRKNELTYMGPTVI